MKNITLSLLVALSLQSLVMAGTIISRPTSTTPNQQPNNNSNLPPISSANLTINITNDAYLVNGSVPKRFMQGTGLGLSFGFGMAISAYLIQFIATLATKNDCFIPHTFKGAFAFTTLAAMSACIYNLIGLCKGKDQTNTAMYLGGTLSTGIATGLLFTLSPTTNRSLYF